MDSSCYSSLLNFIVCELTIPLKTHILYPLKALDKRSLNHHFLTAGAEIAKENLDKRKNSSVAKYISSVSKIYEEHIRPKPTKKTKSFPKGRNDSITKNKDKLGRSKNNMQPVKNPPTTSKGSKNDDSFQSKGLTDEEFDNHVVIEEEEVEFDWSSIENLKESALEFQKYQEMINFDAFLLISEEDFTSTFRVTHSSFKKLVLMLSNENMEPIENIPLYKKLLIVLWLLGHHKSYKDAAQLFNVTEEAVANCFYDVCATLYDKSDNIINWPNSVQCSESAERIEQEFGFPGVVGVLGCHYFSMSIPKEALSRREHFNGKLKTYCLALQIVCDDKFVIRDIFPGLPGGKTENQVFKESPLCEQLKLKTLVEPNKHILARSNYPQLPSMLTPYTKAPDELTQDEIDFNDLHENVCQLVDQTFCMLAERFVSLKRLDPEVATMVIVTACVIHNVCMENCDYV